MNDIPTEPTIKIEIAECDLDMEAMEQYLNWKYAEQCGDGGQPQPRRLALLHLGIDAINTYLREWAAEQKRTEIAAWRPEAIRDLDQHVLTIEVAK